MKRTTKSQESSKQMKTYKIPVVWQVAGVREIEAESLEAAIFEAEEGPLPQNGEYIEDSFEVDYEGIPLNNPNLPVDKLEVVK